MLSNPSKGSCIIYYLIARMYRTGIYFQPISHVRELL
jgi:hypothetical protein